MKKLVFILLFCPIIGLAQGGFKKGVREGDAYRIVTNDGIQFNFGATYQMTPKTSEPFILTDNNGQRGLYTIDPAGKLGFFAEIGMVNFPAWKGLVPIKFLKKSRLLDYTDWGIGYKQYRGAETTNLDNTNALGVVTSSTVSSGTLSNGFIYGRFSAHTLLYVGKKKIDVARKYFIDNAIGFNFDYNIMRSDESYQNGIGYMPGRTSIKSKAFFFRYYINYKYGEDTAEFLKQKGKGTCEFTVEEYEEKIAYYKKIVTDNPSGSHRRIVGKTWGPGV